MNSSLDSTYFFNSRLHPGAPPEDGHWVDLANDPSAAHRLIRLGVSTRRDLPAVLIGEPGGKLRVMGLALTPEEARRLAAGDGLPAGKVRLYGSAWCPDCRRAKRLLDELGVRYEEVSVDVDPEAEALVLERSGGRRVVPTLEFDGRIYAFNPDPWLLRRLLNQAPTDGAELAAGPPPG